MVEITQTTLQSCFRATRYTFDNDRQRYEWTKERVNRLLDNLIGEFNWNYKPDHERKDGANYTSWSLGTISIRVVKPEWSSFLDGHDLFITLALLLLGLQDLQRNRDDRLDLEHVVSFSKFGQKTLNPDVEPYKKVLLSIYHGEEINLTKASASVRHLVACYENIKTRLQNEVETRALPLFAEWLLLKTSLQVVAGTCDTGAYLLKSAHAYNRLVEKKNEKKWKRHKGSTDDTALGSLQAGSSGNRSD